MLKRELDLVALLKKKSFFLLGPRATGKSFLIRQQFSQQALIVNLLQSQLYLRLSEAPQELETLIDAEPEARIVVIDEVQRIPMLLNEVHRLIEERGIRFLLTGSSARKLKKGNVNLLAGRAWQADFFPLTTAEIPQFNLDRYLNHGGLPPVYLSETPEEELNAYIHTYLQEEIRQEALVRKIPAFLNFLKLAALTSGQMLNYSNIASDIGVSLASVREYYTILEDTLVGFYVPAWTLSIKRKAISTSKFYLFDLGVKHTLLEINKLEPKSDQYGQAFEHFIALELRAYLSYRRLRYTLSYWRSKHQHEVDFIVGNKMAIEVKTTSKTQRKHCQGLLALAEEGYFERYILISQDRVKRKEGVIEMWYWKDFLTALWQDKFVLY